MKCPGQDSRYWQPDHIFHAFCPKCRTAIEFFKDDPYRRCSDCGVRVKNPEMDMGCAEYCEHASKCLEIIEEDE